ncbi:unnamed protein product [Rotaria sp. Silwood1]|nr:unnamed protein product [Rotaria sp. Silwood1]
MARMLLDISQLPQDVLTYTNKRFFDFIEGFCGKDEADLLSIQAIRSVDSFLFIEDVYSIFTVDSEDVIEIQTRCAFKNRNGTFTVKPGIKSSLNYVLSLLKEMKKEAIKQKKNHLVSTPLIVSTTLVNGVDSSSIDTVISPFISKKNEAEHNEFIITSIEQWFVQNTSAINFRNINFVCGIDYHLKFSPSLDKVEVLCSCGSTSSLVLAESDNFKKYSMTEALLSIPLNVFDLRDKDFFNFIEQFCGEAVMEYFELLGLILKKKIAFHRSDGSYIIKIGIQHDVNKLMKTLRNLLSNKAQVINDPGNSNELIFKSEVFQQHPFLKRLIDFYNNLLQNHDTTNEIFLHHFLDNILSNIPMAKSRHRYQEEVLDFAICLFILSGRNAYEFLRRNIPGALPTITTVQTKLAKQGFRAIEGLTTVQRKIIYDTRSNSFVGFSPPLDEYGMPRMKHFQTNSIEDLKRWFQQEDISNLVNLYMIQPININNQKISPYALAAYGTNVKYTSFDVIRRWFTIFDRTASQGVRLIGYSTDADSSPTTKHPLLLTVGIPKSWSWFFLPAQQLFLCMQDAVHICTKLRNRLLSTKAVLMMGDGLISIDYLFQLIQSRSKFYHNLVKSDICPTDKQNFKSCQKLCAAIECLQEINGSYATVVYLTIIRCIIIAFIDSSTTTAARIYHAWLAVYTCRLWRIWLNLVPQENFNKRLSQMATLSDVDKNEFKQKTTKRSFFITSTTFFCIELNAHHLTYLTLLVAENQLPSETLNVSLFSSQTCKNFFRLSRSISGTFSTHVNFSVQQFLNRQEKISMLNSIKTQSSTSSSSTKFVFRNHHKTQQNHEHSSIPPEKMTKQQVEEQVERAFKDAVSLLLPLGIKDVLQKANIVNMNQVSRHVYNDLNRSTKKANFFKPITIDECYDESDSDSDESVSPEDPNNQANGLYSWDDDDENNEDEIEDDNAVHLLPQTNNIRLQAMKGVRDTINPDLQDSYFLVNIDGKRKYLHKNTAIWYLTDEKHKLSSDRLNRVMEN